MSYTNGSFRRLARIGLNRGLQPWESRAPTSLGVNYGSGLGFVIGRNSGASAAAGWSRMTSRLALSTSANPNSKSMSTPRDEEMKGGYKTPKTPFLTMLDRLADILFLSEIFKGLTLTAEAMMKPKVSTKWDCVVRCSNVLMWLFKLISFPYPQVTINFPHEKGVLSPRFRGEHALRRYPSGIITIFYCLYR